MADTRIPYQQGAKSPDIQRRYLADLLAVPDIKQQIQEQVDAKRTKLS